MIILLPTKTSGEKSFLSENVSNCNFFYVYNTDHEYGEVYINDELLSADKLIEDKKVDILIVLEKEEDLLKKLNNTGLNIYQGINKIVKDNISSLLEGHLNQIIDW
jgi:predicted Fe-Mo cluster-binding NifX family protein